MHLNRFIRLSFLVSISLCPVLLYGQYYNIGQDPGFIRWREISTPQFRIIYPANFEAKAQKMVRTLDFISFQGGNSLVYKPKRIPFIVHSYNTEPNAVTVWAPKRVELFTCPPQDSYAQDWLDQLIIHEYRHVVQIDRTNQGFTKALSWLTGEQAATMVNGLFVPSWFMEGDAVCAETALSKTGRGRVPAFEMLLRSQIMQKGAFSYDKAALGSYRTFVPNQYVLGYSLVANIRRKYSYRAWISALDEVARKPFIGTPFNHGLKKATGFGKVNLYRMTMMDMDSMWKQQDVLTSKSAYKQLTSVNIRKYENHKYPHYLNDTLVVDECSGMDDITCFNTTGPRGFSKKIVTPGFLSSEIFSVVSVAETTGHDSSFSSDKATNSFLLAWTETISDVRWQERSYSVIRIYNGNTGQTRTLTTRSRYFAPSFSPDGRSLALVTIDPENMSSIVLIDAASGKETDTIIRSGDEFYMTPAWSEDGARIVFTKVDSSGKSIVVFDRRKPAFATVVLPTFTEISNPVFARGRILFNGSYSGIENIYATDLAGTEVFQVTSAEFGACNANLSPGGNKIVYSNYSSTGYSLVEAAYTPDTWKRLDAITDYSPSLYKFLVAEEAGIIGPTAPKSVSCQSKPYNKAAHIFNFHSWAPAYINYLSGENGTGLSFMSQNELSTATTVIGYRYDMGENTGKVTADFSWQAWYPMIDLQTSYGARAAYTGGDTSVRYNFNETIISGGFTLPLLFTGGKYYSGLRLKFHSSLTNIAGNTSPREEKISGSIHSLDYYLYAYKLIKQSGKDLYPKWGQVVTGSYRHSPFGANDRGTVASAGIRFYFPGLLNHHGVKVDLNWQQRNRGTYPYPNQIVLPRGYQQANDNSLTCFALNYKFPFAYPDLSLGPLVYIKRLKANVFYDGGVGGSNGLQRKLQSAGVELTSDMHFLRFVFPVDLGFRFGYRPIEKQYFTDFLFLVNLSN